MISVKKITYVMVMTSFQKPEEAVLMNGQRETFFYKRRMKRLVL